MFPSEMLNQVRNFFLHMYLNQANVELFLELIFMSSFISEQVRCMHIC